MKNIYKTDSNIIYADDGVFEVIGNYGNELFYKGGSIKVTGNVGNSIIGEESDKPVPPPSPIKNIEMIDFNGIDAGYSYQIQMLFDLEITSGYGFDKNYVNLFVEENPDYRTPYGSQTYEVISKTDTKVRIRTNVINLVEVPYGTHTFKFYMKDRNTDEILGYYTQEFTK